MGRCSKNPLQDRLKTLFRFIVPSKFSVQHVCGSTQHAVTGLSYPVNLAYVFTSAKCSSVVLTATLDGFSPSSQPTSTATTVKLPKLKWGFKRSSMSYALLLTFKKYRTTHVTMTSVSVSPNNKINFVGLGRKREFHSRAPFVAAPTTVKQYAASPTKNWLDSSLG